MEEVSPFWTLDFSVHNGIPGTTLRAKTADAHILDPITITPTLSFRTDHPEDEELRLHFEHTLDFGGRVELPAGYVSHVEIEASPEARLLLPDADPTTSEFAISTAREQLERPIRCSYQAISVDGEVLAQFPVYIRERTAGARGATLYGSDPAHIATFEVGIPRLPTAPGPDETLTMGDARLQLDLPDSLAGYDIDSILPVLRVLAAATEDTQIRFEMPGFGYIGGGPLDAAPFPDAPDTYQLVADLHRMQQLTGAVLRFPANVTNSDVKDLRNAVCQLDGEAVEHDGGLTLNLRPESVGDFLQTLKNAPEGETAGGFLAATDSMELQIGDLTLPYGPAAFWAPRPRLSNLAELEALAASGVSNGIEVYAQFEPTEHPFRWLPRQQAEAYFESGERPAELGP